MKAIAVPYDMYYADGVYTLYVSVSVLADGQNFNHVVYPTSTSFNPLLTNWKSKTLTKIDELAELEEYEIDQVLFLPDFSLLGL